MPRWLWWTPLVVLTGVLGLFAFRTGWQDVFMAETKAINHFAARYVAEHGPDAVLTDCHGRPAREADIWLVIECMKPGQRLPTVYMIDRNWRQYDPKNLVKEVQPET